MAIEANEKGELKEIKLEEELEKLGREISRLSLQFIFKQSSDAYNNPTKDELKHQKFLVSQHTILRKIANDMKRAGKVSDMSRQEFEDILRDVMSSQSSIGDIVRKIN